MRVNHTLKQSQHIVITTNFNERIMTTTITQTKIMEQNQRRIPMNDDYCVDTAITNSWSKIAPFWPLKNLIAVNPIAGFEHLTFEKALNQAHIYFQQKDIPGDMLHVNRESIKWLQAFFDEGQATIKMPLRDHGLLNSILSLLRFDKEIHQKNTKKRQLIEQFIKQPQAIITKTLAYLDIPSSKREVFLTLMLTTLPGWAAYIQYRTNWANSEDTNAYPVTQTEYLALRLVLTCLIWPNAKAILAWHEQAKNHAAVEKTYQKITEVEIGYQKQLVSKLDTVNVKQHSMKPDAQLVFCIDVRSEGFRRALEAQGNYETYGFAGFFGVPVSVENAITNELHVSCPVLLKPSHHIVEHPNTCQRSCKNGYYRVRGIKKLYQSVKYTFTTPFSLVETLGIFSGLWMGLKSFAPMWSKRIQSRLQKICGKHYSLTPDVNSITLEQQVNYGASVLNTMGLTKNFAPLIVFCGHGSSTQNNAYATALDCGACGGNHGAPNARIIAAILNSVEVRQALKQEGIDIPNNTLFLGAEHNTTTDEVELYDVNVSSGSFHEKISSLKQDLEYAKNQNSLWRSKAMGMGSKVDPETVMVRATDWAQVRPEWGLAKNATFIVGPRELTKNVNLEGRAFLHSYNWEQDSNGKSLSTILTAPMVVAQWINMQYLFSTLDNVAFGGGSKTTQNITGKIGIMQGNASDFMHGLSLQSVYMSDHQPYHQAVRLTVVVYAPTALIDAIIEQQNILQELFGNGWIHMICYDPKRQQKFSLQRDLTWSELLV